MIKNIGGKLQGLGTFIVWGGCTVCGIVWAILQILINGSGMSAPSELIAASWIILILGPVSAITTGWFLNGFGTLINNTMPKKSDVEPLPKVSAK
jgi:hypothetical protein